MINYTIVADLIKVGSFFNQKLKRNFSFLKRMI